MKILVVDDHKETVKDFSSLLRRKLDAQIVVAHTGDEAVNKAIESNPDIVLLDVQLPVLDGFEVMEQLKERRVETRVIMISGVHHDIKSVVRCIRAGACDFYRKPVSSDVIVESIRRHLALESALNLSLANSPGTILQLLSRSDDFGDEVHEEVERLRAQDAERNRVLDAERVHRQEMERRRKDSQLLVLETVLKVAFVVVAFAVIWAMHYLQILESGGANIAFFLFLVLLLLVPNARIRDVVASLPGVKAHLKIDPVDDVPSKTDQA